MQSSKRYHRVNQTLRRGIIICNLICALHTQTYKRKCTNGEIELQDEIQIEREIDNRQIE